MNNKIIIDLRSVSKTFRVKTQDVSVLKKINLEVREGFSIIFGPSGCGKSTLLHIILGLEPPTAGTVHFFDFNFYGFEEDERSEFRKNNIGMIYQQPNWIKSLTVLENVSFASLLLGIDKEKAKTKAREVLKMVGLIDWADYLPTELSSGQQQKVSLARALITDPKVIIADEPTGNLDYQSGIELMRLLKKLEENGKSIIMVTHNVENIDFASSVVQMFDGQVVKKIDMTKEKLETVKKDLIKKNETIISTNQSAPSTFSARPPRKLKVTYPPLNFNTFKAGLKVFKNNFTQTFRFVGLLTTYLLSKLFIKIGKPNLMPQSIFHFFEKKKERTISQVDLIDISIKNILAKKTRAAITIGGMVLGIGAIVFLVSIGYGLEKLVISRVARLDEMKQIDAIPAVASNVKITDKSLASFKDIINVTKVLPIIGVVGKINYQNSNTDVAIYGVMSDYLKESAIKPIKGRIFTSNEINNKLSENTTIEKAQGEVAGVTTQKGEYLEKIKSVNLSIEPNQFLRVRKEPSISSTILGYTRRVEGTQTGDEYWGGKYISDDGVGEAGTDEKDNKLGKWVKVKVALWEQKNCGEEKDCEQEKYIPLKDDEGHQVFEEGYFAEVNMKVEKQLEVNEPAVLGVSTDLIEIASMEGAIQQEQTKTVTLQQSSKREAIVNKAFLAVLGIKENESIGKKFNISFVATEGLTDENKKVISSAVEYKILGVTPDTKTPIAYVPIIDVKQLGLTNYSQVKLVITNEKDLAKVRKQIEVMGFKTTSVADTVSQIEALFKTLRLILGLLGIVALSVAALGMFNTLTVSLLERTHEIGMMKAIGMKSVEVHDLFLTESMIMGVFGGLGGLLFGIIIGKILSLILTVFAVFKGAGFIDITYIPFSFVFLIILLSLTVGIITGIYPAHRATKISALDALRYE
ncbi:MAG: ATP-binding cassette domain-containing protein [Candidatus Roizmanbacteria bacterium]|nr:ATP-binding cassette domain-containing protein [Candidatus Roizmanbacteria bacterium]